MKNRIKQENVQFMKL